MEVTGRGRSVQLAGTALALASNSITLVTSRVVHPGLACRLVLTTRTDERLVVAGSVRQCRYVGRGGLHEIVIVFDVPLALDVFRPSKDVRVAVVDPDESAADAVRSLLGGVVDTASWVPTARIASNLLASRDYDAVFCELALPDAEGEQFVRVLRGHGYIRPVVALTSMRAVDRTRCQRAGYSDVVLKPLGGSDLRTCLEGLVDLSPGGDVRGGVNQDFLRELRSTAAELERSFVAREDHHVRDVSRELMTRAASCGYERLARAARALHAAEGDLLRPQLNELVRACLAIGAANS